MGLAFWLRLDVATPNNRQHHLLGRRLDAEVFDLRHYRVPFMCSRGESALHAQVFHPTIALHSVAAPAEELEVREVVGATPASRDDVIHFEVARLEVLPATSAEAALLAVERLAVLAGVVARKRAEVRAFGGVRPVRDIAPESLIGLYPLDDQLGGLR